MEGILGWFLIIAIIALVVSYVIASKFSAIAESKGHQGYFIWCFFLGIVGWVLVAALPDLRARESSAPAEKPADKDELPDL